MKFIKLSIIKFLYYIYLSELSFIIYVWQIIYSKLYNQLGYLKKTFIQLTKLISKKHTMHALYINFLLRNNKKLLFI